MNPSPDQIARALPHVRYEIESLLQTPAYDQANKALEESVYFRKMAHCRALYHFFNKKERREDRRGDDILSADFGFPSQDVYGQSAKDLVKRFNKDLLHLTYERLTRTPDTKPWPMDALFPPVAQLCREFIEHILTKFTGRVADDERKLWAELKSDVARGTPLQQNTSNVAERITSSIEIGRPS